MVKKIRIKNFKSLEDVEIDISQLTFLFGANSSGKSSFLKALMFLRSNLDIHKNSKVNYKISDNLHLRTFEQVVTNHKTNRIIQIELELEGKYRFPKISSDLINTTLKQEQLNLLLHTREYSSNDNIGEEKMYKCNFYFEVMIEGKESINRESCNIQIESDNSDIFFVRNESGEKFCSEEGDHSNLFNSKIESGDFWVSSILNKNYNLHGNGEQPKHWKNLKSRQKIRTMYQMLEFLSIKENVLREVEKFLKLKHLGITREIPKSEILYAEFDSSRNIYYGLTSFLEEMSHREMNYKVDELDDISIFEAKWPPEYRSQLRVGQKRLPIKRTVSITGRSKRDIVQIRLFELINSTLLYFEFGLIYRIFWSEVDGEKKILNFNLQDGKMNMLEFENASSGFIQLFPIIAVCCILTESLSKLIPVDDPDFFSTVLLEQPELHLHPKLQSQLATFFNFIMKNTSENKRIFIETHSEHLIRKIQVLIAKGELEREKVGVWYFKKVDGVTKVEKMEIDENGLFKKDWPDGFFDDSIDLTMELFEALRKRKN